MFVLCSDKSPQRTDRRTQGFSLVEMLTVIALVAILSLLLVTSMSAVRRTALKSQASADMRQIGTAVLAFANDHDGTLPGPSGLGVTSYYMNAYPQETNLAACIAPYLGISTDTVKNSEGVVNVPQLACPLASEVVDNADGVKPPPYYVQNYVLPIPRGRIFGAQAWGNSDSTQGWMLSRIQELGADANIWMLTNLDQSLPTDMPSAQSGSITTSGWFSRLPETPVWGDTRLRLYLDGHVESVARDAEP